MILPELLLPAGNLSKLRMAVAYGADAVYVGAAGFSMRPDEASFSVEALAQAVAIAHDAGRRLYVAVNTLLFDEDLDRLETWIKATRGLAFDAVIVSDPGALGLFRARRPELRLHISTQASTANRDTAAFWGAAGAARVVLARECTLAQAAAVARASGVEVEVFVHGAMCVAVSGRCLLSAHLCGRSGNRGACKHSCRWEWEVVERKRPGETFTVVETGRETIFFGSTDLCLVEHLPALARSGVRSLKVEGRMKSEYYVANVARVYRDALDRYARDPSGFSVDPLWMRELEAVSHRPYATGFAFGYPGDSPAGLQAHNRPESTYDVLGVVTGETRGVHAITVKNPFATGERVEWIAPGREGTDSLRGTQGELDVAAITGAEGLPVDRALCGTDVAATFAAGRVLPRHAILRRRRPGATKTGVAP